MASVPDLNHTAPPRSGEELDPVRLAEWLGVPEVTIEQFPAGHSNLTYLVRCGTEQWVLRRPPFGSRVKSAHDMGREFRVLSPLHKVFAPAPKPIAFCEDESVLGAPFYLMERRTGVVIRRQLLEPYRSSPELCDRLSTALVETLAALHNIDLQTAGLAGLGKPQGYVARQVEGWTRRWQGSQTTSLPAMDSVAAWLDENKPAESGAAMIHNDYKLDNLLLAVDHPAQVSALLDWEMATIGDPLMDVGSALAYWVEPGDPEEIHETSHSPTAAPGFCSRVEFLERYERATGRAVQSPLFYYVYGLFKLAVILQQIYIRFVQGLTQDARFGALGRSVQALSNQAVRAIEANSLK